MSLPDPPLGVILMTYGSPSSLDDIPRYLQAVRGGRAVDPELVAEFRRRYEVIGGSPLIPITLDQADALRTRLGSGYLVRAGMRFSEPSIAGALEELAEIGVQRIVGIVLSPQYSPLLMSGYQKALEAAATAFGAAAPEFHVAEAWHDQPSFVSALAGRVAEAIERLPVTERTTTPVLLTAHSLPRRVADQEPDYLAQLTATAEAVATAAGIPPQRWTFCWQSAGHEPGEWMKPDFAELMPLLARDGHRSVVVAPVQFLADHLEILYDVDVGAREQAEENGLAFMRTASLNADARFIDALAAVVESEIRAWSASTPRTSLPGVPA